MVDYKFIVEGFQFSSALCPLGVWHRGMVKRGFYQIRHFMLGCGELTPKRKLLKVSEEHGKGVRRLEQKS